MDPEYLSPPPAYSEQEFDQKISRATDLSLRAVQPQPLEFDQDGWPRYDPTVFEAIPTAPFNSSFSSTGNTDHRPSTISVDNVTGSSAGKKDTPQDHQHHDKSTLDRLPSIVPLRIEKKSQSTKLQASIQIPPPSSLSIIDPYYHSTSQLPSPRQSLPAPPRPLPVLQERPVTTYSPGSTQYQPFVPRMDFNPAVAYGKSAPAPTAPVHFPPQPQGFSNIQYNPHSFYNSSVSAQLIPIPSSQSCSSHSHDSYIQPTQSQRLAMATSHSRPGTIPRQPTWQSASRPVSIYSTPAAPQTPLADNSQFSPYLTNPGGHSGLHMDQQAPDRRWY
ncbi:hypothetical protein B0H34DRAFT_233327 [Crassisporium funariophilum]|nr:hypothetical protein B0H34DRAFT_233327 [Crassisporium funariophilum]